MLSPHNPSTIYLGAERVFKSMDRGNTWVISADLTNNIGRNDRPIMGVDGKAPMASKHDGAASYTNIITISESPVSPGRLGRHQRRQRAGQPRRRRDVEERRRQGAGRAEGNTRVTRRGVAFDAGTAYVTFDGHRTDDHKPYVFVTKDYGETWTSISSNLPTGNVNVIPRSSATANLLFLGTDTRCSSR